MPSRRSIQPQIGKKQIRAALLSGEFDPKKPGPMNIVATTGDQRYWMQRASEELAYAVSSESDSSREMLKNRDIHLRNAISLIALALVENNRRMESETDKPLEM